MALTILINDNEGIYAFNQHMPNEDQTITRCSRARGKKIITRNIDVDPNIAKSIKELTPEIREIIANEYGLTALTEDVNLEIRYFRVEI